MFSIRDILPDPSQPLRFAQRSGYNASLGFRDRVNTFAASSVFPFVFRDFRYY